MSPDSEPRLSVPVGIHLPACLWGRSLGRSLSWDCTPNSGSSSPRVSYSHVAARGDVSPQGSESWRADCLGVTKPPTDHRELFPSPKHLEGFQIPGPRTALHRPLALYSQQDSHPPDWVVLGCSGPPPRSGREEAVFTLDNAWGFGSGVEKAKLPEASRECERAK